MDAACKTPYTIGMKTTGLRKSALVLAIAVQLAAGGALVYGGVKTASASFLKLPVSAEALTLGGNSVVLGNGMGAVSANPALLGFIRQPEFQTSYGPHLEGYNFFNAAYGSRGAFMNTGLSFTRIAASDFEGRDAQRAPTGGFSASNMAVNLSAARAFEGFSLGLNAKYISSSIESESASALAADAGVVFQGDKYAAYPCKFGLSIRNLGTRMKYLSRSESLPLSVAAAVGMSLPAGIDAGFNVSRNMVENTFEFGIGMGLKIADSFSLSGGLSREVGAVAASDAMPFKLNAGVGFKVSNFMLNYGFVPMGELGSVQRLSLTFKFSAAEKMERPLKGPVKRRSISKNRKW